MLLKSASPRNVAAKVYRDVLVVQPRYCVDAETKIKMTITIIIVLSNERDKSAEEKLTVSTSLIEGRGVTLSGQTTYIGGRIGGVGRKGKDPN